MSEKMVKAYTLVGDFFPIDGLCPILSIHAVRVDREGIIKEAKKLKHVVSNMTIIEGWVPESEIGKKTVYQVIKQSKKKGKWPKSWDVVLGWTEDKEEAERKFKVLEDFCKDEPNIRVKLNEKEVEA
jgi:hypothetical protein